mmetsp:Transcript_11597/g.27547  ORF Transcript_11597/g.27547 Transcript_11597/m.27547 type:complete len:288 (+) Transcript_11597:425-1288(+)
MYTLWNPLLSFFLTQLRFLKRNFHFESLSSRGTRLKHPLVWIDLEMTGLNPLEDKIMEIACVVTDGLLNQELEGPELAIRLNEDDILAMNDWCQEHHHSSGLVQRCRESNVSRPYARKRALARERDDACRLRLSFPPSHSPSFLFFFFFRGALPCRTQRAVRQRPSARAVPRPRAAGFSGGGGGAGPWVCPPLCAECRAGAARWQQRPQRPQLPAGAHAAAGGAPQLPHLRRHDRRGAQQTLVPEAVDECSEEEKCAHGHVGHQGEHQGAEVLPAAGLPPEAKMSKA